MLDLITCAGNVLVIKPLQHVSGALTMGEMTQVLGSEDERCKQLVFQRILLKRKKK